MAKRTKDPDALALVAACKAIERSTSTRMLRAALVFMWDRYLVNPPRQAWWSRRDGQRPAR